MTKLYIPEIGDQIVLNEDWKFNLHYEYRNRSLLDVLIKNGYETFTDNDVSFSIVKISNDPNKNKKISVVSQNRHTFESIPNGSILYDYHFHRSFNTDFSPGSKLEISIDNDWESDLTQVLPTEFRRGPALNREVSYYDMTIINPHFGYLVTTLPKGTVLKIDRIYIRKGKEGLSSITFYIENCPVGLQTKKRIRFWVSLKDCNNMEII